jgi:hypothetical protein
LLHEEVAVLREEIELLRSQGKEAAQLEEELRALQEKVDGYSHSSLSLFSVGLLCVVYERRTDEW